MSCPVCFRALAAFALLLTGIGSPALSTAQSEPAASPKQADPNGNTSQTPGNTPTSPQPPGGTSPAPTKQPPAGQTPAGQTPSDQQGASPTGQAPGSNITSPAGLPQQSGTPQLLFNPAEQRYGLPKNPQVGPLVQIDLSKPLTLEQAILIALQQQNSIAIAKAQADQAHERLIQARSAYYPQITPSLSYIAAKQPGGTVFFNGVPVSGNNQTETRTDLIAAQYLIWDTGRREATVGLNRRTAFAAEYTLGDQRQTVILNVIASYYNVLRDQELVRAEQENVRRAQATLESIQAQVQVGNAARTDELQSESDLANAQITLLQAQSNLNTDQATLKNAMGVVSNQPLLLAQVNAPVPDTRPDTRPLEYYVHLAYANRMDIKAEQERVYALGYNVRIANINAGISAQADITEGYQLDPNAGEERQFNVSITYPLFDGGNTRAAVREAKAALEQEHRTLDQLEQAVRLNIEQEYLVRELARQSIVASQTAVQAGQLNYTAALEKQRNGLINIVDVITAEAQLITAQVNLIQALYNFYIADASLQRDIGLNDPSYTPKVPNAKRPSTPNVDTPVLPAKH